MLVLDFSQVARRKCARVLNKECDFLKNVTSTDQRSTAQFYQIHLCQENTSVEQNFYSTNIKQISHERGRFTLSCNIFFIQKRIQTNEIQVDENDQNLAISYEFHSNLRRLPLPSFSHLSLPPRGPKFKKCFLCATSTGAS